MTPCTGSRWPRRPGGTASGSWPPACAPSTCWRCAGCCRTRSLPSTCSTSCSWRTRPAATSAAASPATPEYCIGAWTAAQPRGPAPGPGRQTRGHARCRRAWPADRYRLDRQGRTPRSPQPARPRHRHGPGRAGRADRLWQFYNWCAQNYDIPELVSLATTTDRWAGQIVCAVITGVNNERASYCTSWVHSAVSEFCGGQLVV